MPLTEPLTEGERALIRQIAWECSNELERRMSDAMGKGIADAIRLHSLECAAGINGRMASALKAAVDVHAESCAAKRAPETSQAKNWRLLLLCGAVSLLGGAGANATLGPLLKVLFQGITGT